MTANPYLSLALLLLLSLAVPVHGHQSGYHRWHTCPPDRYEHHKRSSSARLAFVRLHPARRIVRTAHVALRVINSPLSGSVPLMYPGQSDLTGANP